jgi:hypothetical protein
MDTTEQILATGGVSGTLGLVLFLVYKLLFSKNKIRSSCCGKTIELETNPHTPTPPLTDNPLVLKKNIEVIVEPDGRPSS